MCRSIDCGGRRCPSSKGSANRAYQRARYAHKKAEELLASEETTKLPYNDSPPSVSLETVKENAQALREEMKEFFDSPYNQAEILREKGFYSQDAYVKHLEERNTEIGYQLINIIDQKAEWEDIDPERGTELADSFLKNAVDEANAEAADAMRINDEIDRVNRRYRYDAGNKMKEFAEANGWTVEEMKKIQRDGINAYNKKIQPLEEQTHPELEAKMRKLSSATFETLKEVRPFGGKLEADGTNKKLIQRVEDSIQVYPSDWIKASNDSPARMVIKTTTSRAEYGGHMTPQYAMVARPYTRNYYKREHVADHTPSENSYFVSRLGGAVTDEDTSVIEHIGMFSDNPKDKKPKEDFSSFNHISQSSMAKKAEWEWREYSKYENGDFVTKEGWVAMAKSKRKRKTQIGSQAELKVSKGYDSEGDGNEYRSAAIHEFGHRAQESVPGIAELEMAFRNRRETDENGIREKQVAINTTGREFGYKDNYPIPYVGKSYPERSFIGRRFTHTEVLTVGMQSIFNNEMGGLKGITTKHSKDEDYRAFCLGLLATR